MLGKNSKLGKKESRKSTAKRSNVEASRELKTCKSCDSRNCDSKNCSSKTNACTRNCTRNCK